jgi:hypothetical protein
VGVNTLEWSESRIEACFVLRKLTQAALSIAIILTLVSIAAILIGHEQSEPAFLTISVAVLESRAI